MLESLILLDNIVILLGVRDAHEKMSPSIIIRQSRQKIDYRISKTLTVILLDSAFVKVASNQSIAGANVESGRQAKKP